MNFGERLLDRRKSLKVTQQDLANVIGVIPQHISLIEQDKVTPSLNLVPDLPKSWELQPAILYLGSKALLPIR